MLLLLIILILFFYCKVFSFKQIHDIFTAIFSRPLFECSSCLVFLLTFELSPFDFFLLFVGDFFFSTFLYSFVILFSIQDFCPRLAVFTQPSLIFFFPFPFFLFFCIQTFIFRIWWRFAICLLSYNTWNLSLLRKHRHL